MAKLIKVETVYAFYTTELTDEQVKRFKSGDEGYEEVIDEVCDELEYTRDKDGGTEYYIEE